MNSINVTAFSAYQFPFPQKKMEGSEAVERLRGVERKTLNTGIRDDRIRISGVVFGVLLIGIACFPAFAKGSTTKITLESPRLAKPIEITDPAITNSFQVFAGPGTSGTNPSESRSLIMDWAVAVTPPSGLESYRVSFYVGEYKDPYVVLYAFDPLKTQGFVYLPGKGDEWYRTNIGIIWRHVEGHWFNALARWEEIARPLIGH